MKNLLFALIISAVLFACNNGGENDTGTDGNPKPPVDTTRVDSLPPHPIDDTTAAILNHSELK